VARSQWQMVWLLAPGEPSERVAAVTGYALTWVRTVARRSNARGEAGSGDRRQANRGGPRLLTPEQEAAVDQAVDQALEGADWIGERIGRAVAEETGWRSLRRLDWRRYRPQHAKAEVAAQAAFVPTD
jgi:hypothetical protein